jgi:hypothetical protein
LHYTDAEYCSREQHQNRMRYLFDFMAGPPGNRAFTERIGSNIDWNRAIATNAARHIQYGQYLISILEGTVFANQGIEPPNGALEITAGREAIQEALNNHLYWQGIYDIEVKISEKAMARVKVAGRADPYIRDVVNKVVLSAQREQELQALYNEFLNIQREIVPMVMTIFAKVGMSNLGSEFVCRHRNELWDVWQPSSDVPAAEQSD